MNTQKIEAICNKVADGFVISQIYKYSIYFIFLLMLVSGGTELAFLYSDTIQPLIENPAFAVPITILFVGVIEAINYFGLRSSIILLKTTGFKTALIIFLLIFCSAKTVSILISVGGALKAVEYAKTPPYETTQVYKDSIESYYSNKIVELVNSPHELNQSKVDQLKQMNDDVLKEIEKIRNDKGNYVGNELLYRMRKVITSKEKIIEKNRNKINDIISNDSGIKNGSQEAEKMREELKRKLSEIDTKKSNFDSKIGSKNKQAIYIIIVVEFFAFIFNVLRTFTGIFKTPSEEEIIRIEEKSINKDLKLLALEDKIIEAREKKLKLVYEKVLNKQVSQTAGKSMAAKILGQNSLNDKKFGNMIHEYKQNKTI